MKHETREDRRRALRQRLRRGPSKAQRKTQRHNAKRRNVDHVTVYGAYGKRTYKVEEES